MFLLPLKYCIEIYIEICFIYRMYSLWVFFLKSNPNSKIIFKTKKTLLYMMIMMTITMAKVEVKYTLNMFCYQNYFERKRPLVSVKTWNFEACTVLHQTVTFTLIAPAIFAMASFYSSLEDFWEVSKCGIK